MVTSRSPMLTSAQSGSTDRRVMHCYLDARRFERRWIKSFCYKGPVSGLMAALEAALLMEKGRAEGHQLDRKGQTHKI